MATPANNAPNHKAHPAVIQLYAERVVDLKNYGDYYQGSCAFHDDSKPSFNVFRGQDDGAWMYKCQGCGEGGKTIFDFLMKYEEVPFTEAKQIVDDAVDDYETNGPSDSANGEPWLKQPPKEYEALPLSVIQVFEEELQDSTEAKAWLKKRGITMETAERLHFGYKRQVPFPRNPELANKGWIVMPCIEGDKVVSIKYRSIAEKEFTRHKDMKVAVWFNSETINILEPVYVVEGEMDCAVLEQAGFCAVSLPNANTKSSPGMRDQIKEAREIVLAGDSDEAGRKSMAQLRDDLGGHVPLLRWPEGMKDANQTFLEHCGGDTEKFQVEVERLTAEAQRVAELQPETDPAPATPAAEANTTRFPLTDAGNAERFAADHGDNAKYCHIADKWFIFDGIRWVPDESDKVTQLAIQTTRQMQIQAANAIAERPLREALIKHGLSSESKTRVMAMLRLAQSYLPIAITEFDKDPMLLNCLNGTLDLRTGQLREHRREDMITLLCPVEYDPNAQCPRFMQFLKEVTDGDAGVMEYLQRGVGYSLTGSTKERIIFLLYGRGRNGKSKLIEVLRYIFGTYAEAADFDTFTADFKTAGAARNDIAKLRGARLVTASESEDGKRVNETLVKQVTGEDMITARFLFHEYFEFMPEFKLWLATNHKPVIRGTDEGIWDRIKFVPFTVRIPDEKQDKELLPKLKAEAAGIMRWAVEGLAKYQEHGLQEPDTISKATAEYREEQDVLGQFLSAKCVRGPEHSIQARGFYRCYQTWANSNGEYYVLNERQFSQALAERGFRKVKQNKGAIWKGITTGEPQTPDGGFFS